jgi:hypothetical protein
MFDNWNMMNWARGTGFGAGFGLLMLWSLFWKGLALYRAARNEQKYWFGALLVINTAGILEILYLFVFGKNKLILAVPSSVPKIAKPKTKKKK